jgi:hypothetical protein
VAKVVEVQARCASSSAGGVPYGAEVRAAQWCALGADEDQAPPAGLGKAVKGTPSARQPGRPPPRSGRRPRGTRQPIPRGLPATGRWRCRPLCLVTAPARADRAVLLAPAILLPYKNHCQGRSLRSRLRWRYAPPWTLIFPGN